MRGAAISFDVGVFEEAARLLQTLLVGEDVAFVGMLLGGKFQRQRVELLAAVLEDVARRVGAQKRGDRGVVIGERLVRRNEEGAGGIVARLRRRSVRKEEGSAS